MYISRVASPIILVGILLIGAWFRFQGLDWDDGHRLHPDERFISMVLSALSPPRSFSEYLDPATSSISPFVNGFGSYIYGQVPLTVLAYATTWLGMNDYGHAYLIGRGISALLDTLSIALIYLLGVQWWNRRTGLIGAGLYAFAPLAIQHAHFMVMESWAVFSWLLVFLTLAWWSERPASFLRTMSIGLALGAALGIKANSVILAAFAASFVVLFRAPLSLQVRNLFTTIWLRGWAALCVVFVAALSFRFLQPTIFESVSLFDWSFRPDFSRAISFQQDAIVGKAMFPPQWQWMGTPRWWFPFKNLMLWGLGPMTGVTAVVGLALLALASVRTKSTLYGFIVVFLLSVFLWQGGQFVKIMRYYLPFFSLYVLAAGYALDRLRARFPRIGLVTLLLVFLISGAGAVMFTSVYRRPQTRVAASEWIYQNIPNGDSVALEEWDDPLPLGLGPGKDTSRYRTFFMNVYAPDDAEKALLLQEWMDQADWIVISSYRAKQSIGRLPKHFPLMVRFYQDLDNGDLGFVKAEEFTSFPSLRLGSWYITINDSSADESFWVYDHPTVEIYKKVRNPS